MPFRRIFKMPRRKNTEEENRAARIRKLQYYRDYYKAHPEMKTRIAECNKIRYDAQKKKKDLEFQEVLEEYIESDNEE